jgi:predicted nucleic acid-binding protein
MSAVAWTEFLCGPLEERHRALAILIVPERVPFLDEDATVSAKLFNETGRRRGSLMDCMIAAVALRAGVPLATANVSDFRRLAEHGLVILQG